MKNTKSIIVVAIICLSALSTYAAEDKTVQADYLNSVKITFLSWFSGSTKISYERAFPNIAQRARALARRVGQ